MLKNGKKVEIGMFMYVHGSSDDVYVYDICFWKKKMTDVLKDRRHKTSMFNEYVCKYLEMQEHTNIMVNVTLCISIS